MRKTIDLTDKEIKQVTEYQKRNGLKNFSASIKNIIGTIDESNCDYVDNNIPDDKFALIADALIKIDSKLSSMQLHIAPRSAGEVK